VGDLIGCPPRMSLWRKRPAYSHTYSIISKLDAPETEKKAPTRALISSRLPQHTKDGCHGNEKCLLISPTYDAKYRALLPAVLTTGIIGIMTSRRKQYVKIRYSNAASCVVLQSLCPATCTLSIRRSLTLHYSPAHNNKQHDDALY
jgi:hypothetical protein